MNKVVLESALSGLPVGQVHYFADIGSTNDFAFTLLENGAPDGSLVVADTQTQGRGRLGRKWVTVAGAALAFSLALRPRGPDLDHLAFYAPLAGLAVCQALTQDYHLPAEVKWPNDVLLDRRKTCGILVEAVWQGSQLQGVVVGIGVNVAPSAVPPDNEVLFPATCVEQALGRPLVRMELLAAILRRFFELRPQIGSAAFLHLWQERLAFRGEEVHVDLLGPGETVTGRVEGIDKNGNLRLRKQDGIEIIVSAGDVRLRPLQE
ncbi:MAG: biotin--[acetyl-CoA-carboxylase] ligase [Saprospiraceae bacterium]|nr:biotin--[acetyl-CoA-carboxylase] ligase [Saprospiraceae bacterium]